MNMIHFKNKAVKRNEETWFIEYDLQTYNGVIHMKEAWPCEKGYHKKLLKFYKKNDLHPQEMRPIYKVRGNYIELLIYGGRWLPLESRLELTESILLASKEHPITLIAPNRIKYQHTEF